MNIKSITNAVNTFVSNESTGKSKETKEPAGKVQVDKLEISAEAKKIQKNSAETQKLEEIKEKIKGKFYDSDEVINHVADAIMKEIKQ
jgi:anti-sigma28 factor (negative regulator of flagellin synthesis)